MNDILLVVTAWLVLSAAASAAERPVPAWDTSGQNPTEAGMSAADAAASPSPDISHWLPLKLGPDISAPVANIASR
jgi:hypothetical protein